MSSVPLDPVPARVQASSLSCPSCGAAIAQRAQGWAVTVVCGSCGSVLDATDPNLRVLQQQEDAVRVKPRLALGSRGTWNGVSWEIIGFQVVTITVEGTDYSWREYVLFNPFRGFRYLSEYQGHWNVIEKLKRRPVTSTSGGRPAATYDGREFKHFQSAKAYTTLALGEFPWELRVGDSVMADDYIAPPYMLSAESSDGETTWSLGTYTSADEIGKAFKQTGDMMAPLGVFANQPNPYSTTGSVVLRRLGLFLVVLFAMLIGNVFVSRGEVAYTSRHTFVHGTDDSAAFVTPAFELKGRPSSVTIEMASDVDNDWAYFALTLINDSTGISREVGKQVSYYYGRDSDGSWSEGSRKGSVRLSSVPGGRYFLRVGPEGGEPSKPPVHYTITVKRDTPSFGFYVLAFFALTLPAILAWIPKGAFEGRRWAESDYAPSSGSDDDEGDDE